MGIRATRISISVLLVALIALLGSQSVVAQHSPWINQSAATQYADNLITSYNALINQNQALSPNFASIEHDFPLYLGPGYSFEVLVLRDKPNSTDNAVGFVFLKQIQSSNPEVFIWDNETVQTFYTTPPITAGGQTYNQGYGPVVRTPYGIAAFYVSSNYPQFNRFIPLIWTTNTTEVLDNTMVNSESAAQALYNFNANSATTSSTQATSSQFTNAQPNPNSSNSDQWIMLTVTGIIGTVVGGLILALIIQRMGKKEKRKEKQEAKEAKRTEKMRRKLLRRKKQKVEQPKQEEAQDETSSKDTKHTP